GEGEQPLLDHRPAAATMIGAPDATDAAPAADVALPGTVTRVPVGPVRLMLRLGTFTNPGPASVQARQVPGLDAYVVTHPSGRSTSYAVLAGPYPTARAAEAALDEALRAGVPDARIIARSDADQF
ncbi:SPOR domain-containing protein, partial [Acidisphaera rubrifaciens]|uniref:SPOR domain-containing protein n=1 Tax=Acidisphaera rubrifaciens TaxID=50715 RepID=UPI000662324C